MKGSQSACHIEKEIVVAPWSWKWFQKKIGFGDKSGSASASVSGPGISVNPVCIDPGQVVNRTAAEAADAVINNSGALGRATNAISGQTMLDRERVEGH